MDLRLEDDHRCFICGKDNEKGLRLDFEHPEKHLLRAQVILDNQYQGYKGVVHGGILAALLDEMMVNLAFKEGLPSVTADLNVRFLRPAKTGEIVFLEGKITEIKRGGRAIYASAEAKNTVGELLASATATCLGLSSAPK